MAGLGASRCTQQGIGLSDRGGFLMAGHRTVRIECEWWRVNTATCSPVEKGILVDLMVMSRETPEPGCVVTTGYQELARAFHCRTPQVEQAIHKLSTIGLVEFNLGAGTLRIPEVVRQAKASHSKQLRNRRWGKGRAIGRAIGRPIGRAKASPKADDDPGECPFDANETPTASEEDRLMRLVPKEWFEMVRDFRQRLAIGGFDLLECGRMIERFGPEMVEQALKASILAGVKNWNYARAICESGGEKRPTTPDGKRKIEFRSDVTENELDQAAREVF